MRRSLAEEKVAVLGAGKMGSILLQALLKKGLLNASSTCATVQHAERARALSEKLRIAVGTDNVAAIRGAKIIFICVKPQVVRDVVEEIRPHVTPDQLLIWVAASGATKLIDDAVSFGIAVVTGMPQRAGGLG